MLKNNVKVQIVCVTYNQKDYIKEALDSFLMQKTNFKFEVLVGDDHSSDGTTEIVAEYAKKYPDIIKHIHRQKNMGCLANFMDLCESVTAKYAAFCDGDDYWTDENKLQKQFDFMEKNEDVNACCHKVHVDVQSNSADYNYWKNLKSPFCMPHSTQCNKKITLKDVVFDFPHTSSYFIRWNIHKFPMWSKVNGIGGDIPVLFLQTGQGFIFVMSDKMSVYRKISSGVVSTVGSIENHFIKTRSDYFRILSGCINYFKKNYNSYSINTLESRLWTEIVNYTNAIIKTDRFDLLLDLKEQYPDIYNKVKGLLSEYRFRLQQSNVLGDKRANLLRKKSTLRMIKPLLCIIYRVKKILKQTRNIFNTVYSFLAYWIFALVPKKKNLWVFSGFLKKNYMDNTMYLYKYIVKNHPEIEAVWLTKSEEVRKKLKERKMPVHNMKSPIGIWTMIRANIAFSDHFKMSDYENKYGYNGGTKFVNLWHGVGLKDMRPVGDKIPSTDISGVRLSSDIIISNKDSIFIKLIKLLKYPFVAPYRELVEKYFGILCVGEPFVGFFAAPMKTKESARMMIGYPRHANLYQPNKTEEFKIIYVPTFRWNANDEKTMINMFLENIDKINQLLENINGTFTFRLHPHTWRNYENEILNKISNYTRFTIDKEKDIYKSLADYSLMITDYSSIGFDYLITKKPIIYLAFDKENYFSNDCGLSLPFEENSGGDITYSWQDTLESIKKSYEDPEYNSSLRKEILERFFPAKYNSSKNSKNIVEYLEKKTGVKGV